MGSQRVRHDWATKQLTTIQVVPQSPRNLSPSPSCIRGWRCERGSEEVLQALWEGLSHLFFHIFGQNLLRGHYVHSALVSSGDTAVDETDKTLWSHQTHVLGRFSQSWHYHHLGPGDVLLWEMVLCFVGCLASSLVSTEARSIPSHCCDNQNLSRPCHMAPGGPATHGWESFFCGEGEDGL